MNQRGNATTWVIIILAVGWLLMSTQSSSESDYEYESENQHSGSYNSNYDGYESSSYDYADYSPSTGFSGTDEMEACNQSTGNCYDLEIDSDGENIERINFPNGGYRDVDYSDCDNGYCYVEDEDGTEWELEY